ncbi:MAG: Peptidase domain protein [Verrucomicrobiales bacterium]|nr:Peptidase domain protein [Verrucomicrobiales bacterium]
MRAGFFFLFPLFWVVTAFAAAPTLDQIYPAAMGVGTTNTVQMIGKFDPWPPKVWVDAPGLVFKAETNSGKFTVSAAPDAPVGPHLIRLYNKEGASEPRFLIVAKEPQLPEVEPNDEYSKAQSITNLPAHVNGRLDKSGDVDSYALQLEKNQTLIASIESFVLMAPVDAVLRIVDTNGLQVAFNHDDGRTLDPFLTWTAERAGTYIVQVFGFAYPAGSEVRFTGGNTCVYRLHLSRGPYVHHVLPLGLQRDKAATLQLFGWNLESESQRKLPYTPSSADKRFFTIGPPTVENTLAIPLLNFPELRETEPNNTSNTAQQVEMPCAITGRIEKPGDIDVFQVHAKKGEPWRFQVQSASLGFLLDAWLKVEDEQGKELAKNDDAGGSDPLLEWAAPTNGNYLLSIGNVVHRGGPDYLYHLICERAAPDWKATVASSSFSVKPGSTNEIKVTLKRLNAFKKKIKFELRGLPEGLKSEPVGLAEKAAEASLKLIASDKAAPFAGPIRILGFPSEEATNSKPVLNEFTVTSLNNGVPTGYNRLVVENTDQIWLTVLPKPVEKPAAKPSAKPLP